MYHGLIQETRIGEDWPMGKIFDEVFVLCYTKPGGGMSEWSKEAVLKTVVPKGTVGSNPTPSVIMHNAERWPSWLKALAC
jgi:hypothetical protein